MASYIYLEELWIESVYRKIARMHTACSGVFMGRPLHRVGFSVGRTENQGVSVVDLGFRRQPMCFRQCTMVTVVKNRAGLL